MMRTIIVALAAAVVICHLKPVHAMNSKTMADDWRFTKMYVRQSVQWRVVTFQASSSAQP